MIIQNMENDPTALNRAIEDLFDVDEKPIVNQSFTARKQWPVLWITKFKYDAIKELAGNLAADVRVDDLTLTSVLRMSEIKKVALIRQVEGGRIGSVRKDLIRVCAALMPTFIVGHLFITPNHTKAFDWYRVQ